VLRTLPESIVTIDCQYGGAEKAAAYLVVEGDRAAFVDNNTTHAVPHLLDALTTRGLRPEQVDYVIITHVHLDHAGGSAELLRHCPNATLLAHPKAARHVADPARLIAGAKAVYGDELFEALYGEIRPVEEGRVRSMADGEELAWGGRTLHFFYTLGHASHHFCIHDSKTNSVFTGDAFGIGRTPHCRPGKPFLMCSSTPPEFNAAQAKHSVQQILDTGADVAYIGHFGPFSDPAACAPQLLRSIDAHQEIVENALAAEVPDEELRVYCEASVATAMNQHLRAEGVENFKEDRDWLFGDIRLNAMGLEAAVQRTRKAANR